MANPEIKEYLSRVGIHKVTELDTALIENCGPEEGSKRIEELTALYDQAEQRLMYGGGTPFLRRQQELTDYLNQSLEMSLLASSFYDHVFFRRAMEYLVQQERFFKGDIFDIGSGNGILTCFLALRHPGSEVTGIELSENAVSTAKELARRLQVSNVCFLMSDKLGQKKCGTLFSCRTVHENVAWKPLSEEAGTGPLYSGELTEQHRKYAGKLAELVRPQGFLVSVERYEDDGAYAGLVSALEAAGLYRVKGTHVGFSCRNGDEAATFQGLVFQKIKGDPVCGIRKMSI